MIIGTTLIMLLALNGCASKSQAETIPPTIAATTAAKTTEETTIPEEAATFEEIPRINLPILSTGHQFSEMEAMAYEAVYGNWEAQSDENKVILGRDSLITLVQSALLDFTEQEVNEVTDFILTQLPIPEVLETQPSVTTSVQEESLPEVTKPVEKESQPVQSQPVQSQPEINNSANSNSNNSNSTLTPEQIAADEEFKRQLHEAAQNGGEINDAGANGGHAGKPLEGEINIGGGY